MDRQPAWVTGEIGSPTGIVPVVSTRLAMGDVLGAWGVRWAIGRDRYRVPPGLYAVGSAGAESPVLVTANYKLSFDAVRKEIAGIDGWILVLDTRGVNVWCAAGKGTFGTEELVGRIAATRLHEVVSHRQLILPQLGATGVSAVEVERKSGFAVTFGPVRAADIPAYLASGRRKTPEMRTVRFGLADRLAVMPAEIAHAAPFAAGAFVLVALLVLIRAGSVDLIRSLRVTVPLWGAMLVGTVAVPALLPILPGRAFSLKGAAAGLLWAAAACLAYRPSTLGIAGTVLLAPAAAAFLAMNFTGSTTFTSLSGVSVEVRIATPIIAGAGAVGAVLYTIAILTGGLS